MRSTPDNPIVEKIALLGTNSIFSQMAQKRAVKKQLRQVLETGNADALQIALASPYAAEIALSLQINRTSDPREPRYYFPETLVRRQPQLSALLVQSKAFNQFENADKTDTLVACFEKKQLGSVQLIIDSGFSTSRYLMGIDSNLPDELNFDFFCPLSYAAYIGQEQLCRHLSAKALEEFKQSVPQALRAVKEAIIAANVQLDATGLPQYKSILKTLTDVQQTITIITQASSSPMASEANNTHTEHKTESRLDEPSHAYAKPTQDIKPAPQHPLTIPEQLDELKDIIRSLSSQVSELTGTVKQLEARVMELTPTATSTHPQNHHLAQSLSPLKKHQLQNASSDEASRPKTTPPVHRGGML